MFCNNCGKEVNENSVFCTWCGNRLKSIEVGQENVKPSLKEEIKAAWKSGPEKAEKERMEKKRVKDLEQLKVMKKELQNNLKPKDGKYHVVLIKSKSKSLSDNNIQVLELENILEIIQNEGYEIVDIKIMGVQYCGGTIGSEAIVVYK
jgi:uncharacterized Zn finger protein (UPF0148 family)